MGMRRSRLSKSVQRHLIEHFVAGTIARTASSLCGINRKTAVYYFHRLREIIHYELEHEADSIFYGEVEVPSQHCKQCLSGNGRKLLRRQAQRKAWKRCRR